jgi:hypothetical protein
MNKINQSDWEILLQKTLLKKNGDKEDNPCSHCRPNEVKA